MLAKCKSDHATPLQESSEGFCSQNKWKVLKTTHWPYRPGPSAPLLSPPLHLSALIPSVLQDTCSTLAPLGSLRFCKHINHGSLLRTFALGSLPWILLCSRNFFCLEHSFNSFRVLDKCHLPWLPFRWKTLCLSSFSKLSLCGSYHHRPIINGFAYCSLVLHICLFIFCLSLVTSL